LPLDYGQFHHAAEVTNALGTYADVGTGLSKTLKTGKTYAVFFAVEVSISDAAQRVQGEIYDEDANVYRPFEVGVVSGAAASEYPRRGNVFFVTGDGTLKNFRLRIRPTTAGATARARNLVIACFELPASAQWSETPAAFPIASGTGDNIVETLNIAQGNGVRWLLWGGATFDNSTTAGSGDIRLDDGIDTTSGDIGWTPRHANERVPRPWAKEVAAFTGAATFTLKAARSSARASGTLTVRDRWILAIPETDLPFAVATSNTSTGAGTANVTLAAGSDSDHAFGADHKVVLAAFWSQVGTDAGSSYGVRMLDNGVQRGDSITRPVVATNTEGGDPCADVWVRDGSAAAETIFLERRRVSGTGSGGVRSDSTTWALDLGVALSTEGPVAMAGAGVADFRSAATKASAFASAGVGALNAGSQGTYPATLTASGQGSLAVVALPLPAPPVRVQVNKTLASPVAQATVACYLSKPLNVVNNAITHVVVCIHGNNRNAGEYHQAAVDAATLEGVHGSVAIITPYFRDNNSTSASVDPEQIPWVNTDLWWETTGWRLGSLSTNTNSGNRYSSWDCLDDILKNIVASGVFPSLSQVTICGHSAGGQFATRYALCNRIDGSPAMGGVPMRYVPMNPSSFCYPDEYRPNPVSPLGAPVTSVVIPSGVPTYNDYRWGLAGTRNGYIDSTTDAEKRAWFQTRRQVLVTGAGDTLNSGEDFDAGDEANLQGLNRRDRSERFKQYMDLRYPGNNHAPVTLCYYDDLTPIGHDGQGMWKSVAGRAVIFEMEGATPAVVGAGGSGAAAFTAARTIGAALTAAGSGDLAAASAATKASPLSAAGSGLLTASGVGLGTIGRAAGFLGGGSAIFVGVTRSNLDEQTDADLAALDNVAPYETGIWLNNGETFRDAMDLIAAGGSVWYAHAPSGVLRLGVLRAPLPTSLATIDEAELLEEPVRRSPTDNAVPAWAVTLEHTKNYTVQDDGLPATLSTARREWLKREFRAATSSNAAILTKWRTAEELRIQTLLLEAAAAQAEADRLRTLHGVPRIIYDIVIPFSRLQRLIAEGLILTTTVTFRADRYDLAEGKNFVVIGR